MTESSVVCVFIIFFCIPMVLFFLFTFSGFKKSVALNIIVIALNVGYTFYIIANVGKILPFTTVFLSIMFFSFSMVCWCNNTDSPKN